jgi:hypothetical protein
MDNPGESVKTVTVSANVRFIPIQDICVLCDGELAERDVTTLWLGGWICRTCQRLLRKVPRDTAAPTKFVTEQ